MLAEYEEVLSRARLAIPPKKVARAVARIREQVLLVTVCVVVDAAACPDDPDDLIFLECVEASAADYLVTGNRKHYPGHWKKRGLSQSEFFELIADTLSTPS